LCGTVIVAIIRVGKLAATIRVVRKTFFSLFSKKSCFLEVSTMRKLVLIIVIIGRGGIKRSCYWIERGKGDASIVVWGEEQMIEMTTTLVTTIVTILRRGNYERNNVSNYK
jgi:hypothetical protein